MVSRAVADTHPVPRCPALQASCVVHGLLYAFAESAGVERLHLWAVPMRHLVSLQTAILDAAANSATIYGLSPPVAWGLHCAGPNRRPGRPASSAHRSCAGATSPSRPPRNLRNLPDNPTGGRWPATDAAMLWVGVHAFRGHCHRRGYEFPPAANGEFCWILVDPCPSVAENGYVPPVAGRRLRSVASGARGWTRANRNHRLHGSRACP